MRRKMAFHDALFADFACVETVIGERVDTSMDVFNALRAPRNVLVTWLGLLDLLPVCEVDVLIDARMQTRDITPNFRGMARLSIGIGPGFSTAANCDVAIETCPDRIGQIVRDGCSAAEDRPTQLGGVGAEQTNYKIAGIGPHRFTAIRRLWCRVRDILADLIHALSHRPVDFTR